MNPALVVAPLVGILAALVSEPVIRCLPLGMPEKVAQPPWTAALRRMPTLEVLGALLGALCAIRFGWSLELLPALALVCLLIPITWIDLEWRVIPDALVVPGVVLALGLGALADPARAPVLLLSGLLAGIAFLALVLIYPAGMGVGDVTLVAMLGCFLGPPVALAVLLAFVLASLPAIGVMAVRGIAAGRKVGLPFGPFLALGALIVLFLR